MLGLVAPDLASYAPSCPLTSHWVRSVMYHSCRTIAATERSIETLTATIVQSFVTCFGICSTILLSLWDLRLCARNFCSRWSLQFL
ncbi:hypothetical protein M011DRAFT_168721 [Sporormia fimetaria CBS 119925]|uniref:Uncharacterized protein n=1 Tax=Sporormia fimetaria CBS 119925 TaxID=1340428 RepID=A0A6A6V5H6_9PLEO|nr:hypothetical protein M011DRAFT_168721 [Sporormia fimetaria CBS 119925]